jgi:RNA polymerase sigma factor for flagellar operon FliA
MMGETSALLKLAARPIPRDLPPEERVKAEALREYAPLVKYVVDKIASTLPRSIDKEDLIHTAIIGLFDALEKFDADRGTKFETYAVWRIKGAVLDELRSLDWASRSTRRKAREIDRACQQLEQKLGRAAADHEIARELNLRVSDFSRLVEEVRGATLLSLDQAVAVDDEHDLAGLGEVIEDTAALDALHEMEEAESKEELLGAINGLSEQERLVIALYYYEEMTLKEIGETLGISESRVSQIHTKAIGRLRGRMEPILLAA